MRKDTFLLLFVLIDTRSSTVSRCTTIQFACSATASKRLKSGVIAKMAKCNCKQPHHPQPRNSSQAHASMLQHIQHWPNLRSGDAISPAWKKYTTASGRDGDKYQLWANANEILNTSSFKHCSSYFISFYRKYNLFKGKLFTFKVYLFHSKIISSLSCAFNVPFSFSWHKLVRTKCRNSSAPHILCQLLTTVPPLLSPFSSSC